jgi:hypothetical protein
MSYAIDPKAEVRPPAEVKALGREPERMTYEIHARRKAESVWHVIAQFKNDEDARAALWAIVFTCKYAEVQVLEENSATPVAEWPQGMTALR